jgi:hypothetical protein
MQAFSIRPSIRRKHLFFVPDDTLTLDKAQALGIHSPRQLYGAATPYPFAKTKAITHRLVSTYAERPMGWSSGFADKVSNAVLPGYTAFCPDDARIAARRLLALGPVRVKEPLGDSGHGQTVVSVIAELDAFLERFRARASCPMALCSNRTSAT